MYLKQINNIFIFYCFANSLYCHFSYQRYNEELSPENKEFLSEFVSANNGLLGVQKSPLNTELVQSATWTPGSKRTGLIGKKIGVYPMWLKNGKKVTTTLIQVFPNIVNIL